MPPFKDLSGKKFGRLCVVERHPIDHIEKPSGIKRPRYICRCDCGNEVVVNAKELKNGRTSSCGCLRKENITKVFEKGNRRIDGIRVSALKRKKIEGKTSKYKGVCLIKKTGKWHSKITIGGKVFNLGNYDTEEEAYSARLIAEKILFKPFLEKEVAIKKESFLVETVGFTEKEAKQYLETEQLQNKIEKALEIIKAS